jgi:ABC-2 type transport system ATP-binding protein
MNAIECDALTRHFGKVCALDRLTLQVPAGSVFALLGSNGAGKTTLLKLILNLLRPTSGQARVLGGNSANLRADTFQRIGYVAEDLIQPDWMELSAFLGYHRSLYRSWDPALESHLRAKFALPEGIAIKRFSRGMRMKAILLSTLCFRPELLILDEPFSGLDPQVRDDLIEGILELMAAGSPCTVVISSHDIAEIERLADRVGILSSGRLVLAEPLTELQRRFRRIEVIGPDARQRIPNPTPATWIRTEATTPSLVQFVHTQFDTHTEAELRSMFVGARIQSSPLSLREIFLAASKPSPSANGLLT